MALTITDLGNATSTSSSATLVTGATITASVGDWLVALIAADNNGTSGAASLTSVQDSQSNTWTQRALINRTPGSAAGDGATLGVFVCEGVTNALSSGTVTANFSPNTISKAIEVYRVQPGAGETIQFVACDATGNKSSTATHDAPTVSVTNGDTIFGAAAIEETATPTGDSDTTNGSWSTLIARVASTGLFASSMGCASQWKTVNATGNQSWAATTGSARDSARTYLIVGPVSSTSPFISADFPNPRRVKATDGYTNPLELTLLGQDQFFSAPGEGPRYDYPNPRAPTRASVLNTWTWYFNPQGPFIQSLFDLPPKSAARAWSLNTHTQDLIPNLIGQDKIYGQPGQVPDYDWPLPRAPKRALDFLTWINTFVPPAVLAPFIPPLWTVPPKAPTNVQLSFTDSFPLGLIGQDQFFTSPGQGPVYDYPNPRAPRRAQDLSNWIQSQLPSNIPTGIPFLALWYPNPQIARKPIDNLSWYQSFVLPTVLQPNPIRPIEWIVPKGRPRSLDFNTWLQSNQFNTVTLSPFFKTDWPNPNRKLQGQVSSYSTSFPLRYIAPFKQMTWENPRKKPQPRDAYSWTMGISISGTLTVKNGILLCGL